MWNGNARQEDETREHRHEATAKNASEPRPASAAGHLEAGGEALKDPRYPMRSARTKTEIQFNRTAVGDGGSVTGQQAAEHVGHHRGDIAPASRSFC